MCGIFCEVNFGFCNMCTGQNTVKNDDVIISRVKNRGPNSTKELQLQVRNEENMLNFIGSVLWMQGVELCPQPLETNSGVLLFNGDIFDCTWDKTICDTQLIMDKLNEADSCKKQVLKALHTLKGPFSLIYYDKINCELYFTRDRIGRSSLLFHKNNESIIISSVLGRQYKCIEVPATYIHVLNLNSNRIECHSWGKNQMKEYKLSSWINTLQEQQSRPDEDFTISVDDTQELGQENIINAIENVAQDNTSCKLTIMRNILNIPTIMHTVEKLTQLLEKSVKIRLETQPKKCKDCLNSTSKCNHCTVGILFSGGLDCTILAFLADKYVDKDQPIDLINVAFSKDDHNANYDVPDRLTGKQSLKELQKICVSRKWVFREVNITKNEFQELQKSTIADLVHPRQTILDESLGTALWFAARGRDDSGVSPCRILLLGSGADELFGGYSRHRNAFKYHGWPGLHKELMLDWQRISFRNLARDNRVICDHGRQPRMPYLDEDFTNYVLGLKPWLKCFPSVQLGPGVGDKLMLRLVAFHLGLIEVSTFPKRALQFGSRIANKKEKGSDVSMNFIDL
ncbi:unnamed protein product [Plutella xylostella]|uniref:(diamondback moth) hypothetical protein n=1 Tax=Plutella xylostella TaxID=51655 RepID=A0A8S4DK05_PLUXY|nr:unnamed protein product [Plutella xylostella]